MQHRSVVQVHLRAFLNPSVGLGAKFYPPNPKPNLARYLRDESKEWKPRMRALSMSQYSLLKKILKRPLFYGGAG
jgi:hypothetical protein